jgi:integrase
MSKNLTSLSVEHAKAGTSRREIPDGGCAGLYLIVQPSGHKSWAVRFRVKGIPRKLTLKAGLSLADARIEAATAIKEAGAGTDPTKVKRAAKQQQLIAKANTFAATAELYLARDLTKRLRSFDQIADGLRRLAFPLIGATPVADLKRSAIMEALDTIETVNGPVMADRVLGYIRGVLNFHALRDDDYSMPLVKGMERTSKKDRARTRTLDDDEIRKLWAVGDRYTQFLLLTSARRDEAAAMQWKELDGNVWTLPGARNKTKLDHVRPLSAAALDVLGPRGERDDYVFGATPAAPLVAFSRAKKQIDAKAGIKVRWTFHDLRRTARTLMSRAGCQPDHAERVLGHVIGGIRGNYDRFEFQTEKADALEALAKLILTIVNPPRKPKQTKPKGSNVVQLPVRAA